MRQDLIQITSKRLLTRVILIVIVIVAVLLSSLAFRWYLANTLAEYFDTAANRIDMAQLAISLSPHDPLPHWRLAEVYKQKLIPDQGALVVAEYEKAVTLAPNDYRYWISLGTALEQSGDAARGELALRQAVALAPAYAIPHWYLGNLLLRSGRYDEAFDNLRLAADADTNLESQLFRFAIDIHGNDVVGLKSAIGDNPSRLANFAAYLVQANLVDRGLLVWDNLNDAERKANLDAANSMLKSLIGQGHYHDAMKIWNSVAATDKHKVDFGRFLDGGFEQSLSNPGTAVFDWQVNTVPQLQIGIDPEVAHSGSRSLRLVFQVHSKLDFIPVYTIVPVLPSTEYEFECYQKTEKLSGADTPFVLILSATDNSLLAASSQAPQGASDWTRVTLSFKTGDKTEAVRIHLARTQCEKDKICPIFGAVWYDDFSLKRRN